MSLIKCIFSKNNKTQNHSEQEEVINHIACSKAILLIDTETNIPEKYISKVKNYLVNSIFNEGQEEISMDVLKKNIEVQINRQTDELCVIKGFVFVHKSLDGKRMCFYNYGTAKIRNGEEQLNDEIFRLETNTICNDIVVYSDNYVASIKFEKIGILSIINAFMYGVYSKHKLNTIATTTLISVGSISYIANQSLSIKKNSDLRNQKLELITHVAESLEDQNEALSSRIEYLEHVNNYDDDANTSSHLDIEKDHLHNDEHVNKIKIEKSVLEEERNLLKSQNEQKNIKIKQLLLSISKHEKICRNNGYDYPIQEENASKFNDWINDLQNASNRDIENSNSEELLLKQIESLKSDIKRYKDKIELYENELLEESKKGNSDSAKDSAIIQSLQNRNIALENTISSLETQISKVASNFISHMADCSKAIGLDEEISTQYLSNGF